MQPRGQGGRAAPLVSIPEEDLLDPVCVELLELLPVRRAAARLWVARGGQATFLQAARFHYTVFI